MSCSAYLLTMNTTPWIIKVCFLFLLIYVNVYICANACGGQKRALTPQDLELKIVVSCPMWIPWPELWFLQEHQVLLATELSLQPLNYSLLSTVAKKKIYLNYHSHLNFQWLQSLYRSFKFTIPHHSSSKKNVV